MTNTYTTPKEVTERLSAEILKAHYERRAKRPSIQVSMSFWENVKWLHENGYVTYWPIGPEFEPELEPEMILDEMEACTPDLLLELAKRGMSDNENAK